MDILYVTVLCVYYSVVLPLAGPEVPHLEHQVFLDGTSIAPSHADSDFLQQRGQTPHLIHYSRQELVNILNTQRHTQRVRCTEDKLSGGGETTRIQQDDSLSGGDH